MVLTTFTTTSLNIKEVGFPNRYSVKKIEGPAVPEKSKGRSIFTHQKRIKLLFAHALAQIEVQNI